MKRKYYIETEGGRVYYDRLPNDVHKTTESVAAYTRTPVNACWIRRGSTLHPLRSVDNDLQVVKVDYKTQF